MLSAAWVEVFLVRHQTVMAQHVACGSSLLVDNLAEEKTWLTQCEELGVLSSTDLVEWRKAVSSYEALCRFLTSVQPLLGIWVHRNPELGNVVYVMPGFASVVGCRIIPQTLGPSGLEDSPILWVPVFEVLSDDDGEPTFVLHGREKGLDCLYLGTVKSIEETCNVLLLEVEPKEKSRGDVVHIESLHCHLDEEMDRNDPSSVRVSFSKLSLKDRKRLLEIVTGGVGKQVPGPNCASLFPCLRGDEDRFQKDVAHLSERRAMLINMHKLGGGQIDWNASYDQQFLPEESEDNDAELGDFLSSGDTIGLALKASTVGLTFYKTWPRMDDHLIALYKLPVQVPKLSIAVQSLSRRIFSRLVCSSPQNSVFFAQEYAGLWGGTFGWPSGKPTEDEAGKGLFFLNLSYSKKSEKKKLVATKILEGTGYVAHPNGSTMFSVNVGKHSPESFPWSSGVKHAFTGEGIADGYGFRYPGSKPGSLFVLEDGKLAFVWKESRFVLILQRLNLEELLKKGQRVPGLTPINNFAYLDRSYSNVFANLQS